MCNPRLALASDRRRVSLEREYEAELAGQPTAGPGDGGRREGPQLTFPPPPAPAAPPPDFWEAEARPPALSRRGAPHAAHLAEAELEAQLTRLVLSLMVSPPGGDDAPAWRVGQGGQKVPNNPPPAGLQTAAQRRGSHKGQPGPPPRQAAQPPGVGRRVAS